MDRIRKHSRKREAILIKIRSTKTHPSAEWVYGELKHEIPDLSLGTVYRNIAMFKRDGLIISVGVVDGQERFDGNIREHAHFICQFCGMVIDIEESDSAQSASDIGEKYSVEVLRRSLTYYGKCTECR